MKTGSRPCQSRSHAGFRLRYIVASFVTCGGCAQMCGFEVGAPLEDVRYLQPDAGSARSDQLDTTPDAASPPEPRDCSEFCMLQQQNCPAPADALPIEMRNYFNLDECMGLCALYPDGAATGNTYQCRLEQVRAAGDPQEPSPTGCADSSRGGSDEGARRCGEACEAYCQLVVSACGQAPFPDAGDCVAHCGETLGDDGSTVDPRPCTAGGKDERSGNTIQCRLWHVGVAARHKFLGNPGEVTTHCGHALGARPCQDPSTGPPSCR